MTTWTTCRRCRLLLQVTDGDTVHPLCEPKPTRQEILLCSLKQIVNSPGAGAGDEDLLTRLADELQKLEDQPPQLLAAALQYAAWGWPVFPLKPGSKQPNSRHGFKDATTDPMRIKLWWELHRGDNIGLTTGVVFDVIDIDLPDGPTALKELVRCDALPDIHGHVRTASGGQHLYVEVAKDSGNRARIYPGIDYRGAGGYIVAPPSQVDRGHRWTWISHPSPLLTKEAPP